jgi:putative transposase
VGDGVELLVVNPARATPDDYIDFLLATPKVASATEAARVQPERPRPPAHDAFTRLLSRLEPDPATLWSEVQPLVRQSNGILVLDDTVLDKPYARKMELVGPFWSGKHQRVLRGINLVTLVWTDGDAVYPTDYRLVDPAEVPKRTKNDLFQEMLTVAKARGFAPACVCFDAWYSGKDNLKAVRACGWRFLCQVRSNRRVNWERTGNRPIAELPIAPSGTVVHLEGFGLIKAFRIVATNGDTEHWITNDLGMDEIGRLSFAEQAWAIEEYHRALKQYTEVERCPARLARSQRNHIGLAIRAFVRLEWHRFRTGMNWFEAKFQIIRQAVRTYLADPLYRLPKTATA